MAIKSTLVKSALSLKYKEGVDTAEAFKPLMKYPVLKVQRTNDNVITTA